VLCLHKSEVIDVTSMEHGKHRKHWRLSLSKRFLSYIEIAVVLVSRRIPEHALYDLILHDYKFVLLYQNGLQVYGYSVPYIDELLFSYHLETSTTIWLHHSYILVGGLEANWLILFRGVETTSQYPIIFDPNLDQACGRWSKEGCRHSQRPLGSSGLCGSGGWWSRFLAFQVEATCGLKFVGGQTKNPLFYGVWRSPEMVKNCSDSFRNYYL
jgi:hypothetical protein